MAQNVIIGWALEKPNRKCGWVTPLAKHWMKSFREIDDAAFQFITTRNKMEGIIKFNNGSFIQFLSTENPLGLRGHTFTHLVIDEAGLIKTEDFQVLAPTFLVEGKKVMMISTPKTKNWYYEWFTRAESGEHEDMIAFKATSYDSPVHTKESLDLMKDTTHPSIFRNEYMAEFTDDSGGVFLDYQKSCLVDEYLDHYDGKCYFGIDIARGGEDFSSITIMNDEGKVINREYWQEYDSLAQAAMFAKVIDRYPGMERGYIETNQEAVIFQELRRRYIQKLQIVGFYTTKKNKPPLIQDLATDIYTKDVLLPGKAIDPVLYDEFGYYSYEKKEDGYIKYGHPESKHDDSVMSTALANKARRPYRHVTSDWDSEWKQWNE